MKKIDKVKRGLEIRKDRLETLKKINAPEIIIENESIMIDKLNQELSDLEKS
jgi:hypothetical protein